MLLGQGEALAFVESDDEDTRLGRFDDGGLRKGF